MATEANAIPTVVPTWSPTLGPTYSPTYKPTKKKKKSEKLKPGSKCPCTAPEYPLWNSKTGSCDSIELSALEQCKRLRNGRLGKEVMLCWMGKIVDCHDKGSLSKHTITPTKTPSRVPTRK